MPVGAFLLNLLGSKGGEFMNKQRRMLRDRLLRSEILVLPGFYDALTAKIAAEVGLMHWLWEVIVSLPPD